MMRFILLGSLMAACAAGNSITPDSDIPANSPLGRKLLEKARVLENQEEQFTWMVDYSIKFESCHSVDAFRNEEEGGAEEGANPHGVQHLVQFKLCPSGSSCKACQNSGQYVVRLREFAEVYLEAKKEVQEQECETVRENCNCNYYDDEDTCQAKCYEDEGLDYCSEEEQEFDAGGYMECMEAEFSNAEYYASTYYIGPVCAKSGKAIFLDVFKDSGCSVQAASGTYEKFNYNAALPYSSKSLVETDECISCKEQDENAYYNNGYNNQDERPIELCTELYEQSAKCEKRMSGKSYPDTGSCTYINKILPALEGVYQSGGGGGTAKIFAWLFFFTTVAAGAGAYYYFTLAKRNGVDLSGGQDLKDPVPGSGIL